MKSIDMISVEILNIRRRIEYIDSALARIDSSDDLVQSLLNQRESCFSKIAEYERDIELLSLKVRPEVLQFAKVMELKLKQNDHKGGWEDSDEDYLLHRLEEETEELYYAIVHGESDENVIYEAADVGCFAMMIADKRLRGEDDEGDID